MTKMKYPVTENGNSVMIEIHTAGTIAQNKDLIDGLIAKWKQENPGKNIVGTPDIVNNSSGIHKRASVSCVYFIWEMNQEYTVITNRVFKTTCRFPDHRFCTIRTLCFPEKLDILLALRDILKKDYPFITDKDIQISRFTTEVNKNMIGLEVSVPRDTKIPADYQRLN